MKEVLVVIDMQNDFIDGALGTRAAEEIVPRVARKIEEYREKNADIVFTRDTHTGDYPNTQEGRNLPISHCLENTHGWAISTELNTNNCIIFDKPAFGSPELARFVAEKGYSRVNIVGLVTDVCVIVNAILIKGIAPEVEVVVDARCCAGKTPESHETALNAMKNCQIKIQI